MVEFQLFLQALGLGLDLVGALVLAAPDLPRLGQVLTPEDLAEGRDQLFGVGHLTTADERYDAVWSVLDERVEWLTERPVVLAIEFRPETGNDSLYVVYDEDGTGPFPPQEDDSPVEVTEYRGPIESRTSDEYDWVAEKSEVYGWIGDRIVRTKVRGRRFRGVGATVIAAGFLLQIVSLAV